MKKEFPAAILCAALAWFGAPDTAAAQTVRTTSRTLSQVGFDTREMVDESRRNWKNSGPRPLSTVIWYPAEFGSAMEIPALGDPGLRLLFVQQFVAVNAKVSSTSPQYPLVLLSHGSTSVNLSLAWLGAYLAQRGYIVAAVNHHGNTSAEGQPLSQGFMTPWERAADLSAVLDRLLADPKFGSRINPQRIGAAGHSAGGATVIMLAGGQYSSDEIKKFCSSGKADNSCEPRALIDKAVRDVDLLRISDPVIQASMLRGSRSLRDPRIRAVVAMAPAVGPAFTKATLREMDVPVLVLTAKVDGITPPDTNARWFANNIPGAQLFTLPGNTNHMTFGSECTPEGVRTLDICRDGEGVVRSRTHEDIARRTFDFFERHW